MKDQFKTSIKANSKRKQSWVGEWIDGLKKNPTQKLSDSWVACLFLNEGKVAESRQNDFQALAEACLQVSPQVALRPGEAIFLEVASLRNLASEEELSRKLKNLAQKWGWSAQVSFAANPATALAMARFLPGLRNSMNLPLVALYDYADPFLSNLEDQKNLDEMIRLLAVLHVMNLGDFIQIPIIQLSARFGKEGVKLARRVRGQDEIAWPGFSPAEKVREVFDLDGIPLSAETEMNSEIESLLFILKGLVDRVLTRLRVRVERVSKLRLSLELERWSISPEGKKTWDVNLPVPQGTVQGLMPILRERITAELENSPICTPIRRVEIEVLDAASGRGTQRDFFCQREEAVEAFGSLVGSLSQRLGQSRVFRAQLVQCYLPERAWVRQEVADDGRSPRHHVGISWPTRPARILSAPEPLKRNGKLLIHSSGKAWRVFRWEGPERILGEWWVDPQFDAFNRDYYRVFVETGEQLWVFSNRRSDEVGLYLHGYFD